MAVIDDGFKLEDEAYSGGRLHEEGWYLYSAGEVSGPLRRDTVGQRVKAEPEAFVARKGFLRWYTAAEWLEAGAREKLRLPPSPACSPGHAPAPAPVKSAAERLERLRLGRQVAPLQVMLATLCLPVVGWTQWLIRVASELDYHLGPRRRSRLRGVALCWIPGLHLIYGYGVLQLMVAAERENCDQQVSRLAAVVLLLIAPPLFAAYIQGCVNLHWRRHCLHAGLVPGQRSAVGRAKRRGTT